MDEVRKEDAMRKEIVPGGPTREEAQELNRPKPVQGVALNDLNKVKKAVNVLAASLTAAAGTGLAATAQEALNTAPAPIVQEQKPDPKRDSPPAGVVFPESVRADAPVVEAPLPDASPEPVYTHRSYSPFTPFEAERPETKDITPLWPDKIGEFAPYNFEA